jgi:hypothetical protein
MRKDLLREAVQLLHEGGHTCVIRDDAFLFTSCLRGVRPLVELVQAQTLPGGCVAADKVVGKATAWLYVLLKVSALYADVISEPALTVLREREIPVEYGICVPNIINRRGDGICPFEETVMPIHDPQKAHAAILQKMKDMGIAE